MDLRCSRCKSNHIQMDFGKMKCSGNKNYVNVICSFECKKCGAVSDSCKGLVPRSYNEDQMRSYFMEHIRENMRKEPQDEL